MDTYIGLIFLFGGSFNPRSFMLCAGQLMSINVNTALFAILGTTFGGDGMTTFALPDLRGRIAVGAGQGNGLPLYYLGQTSGATTVVLTTANLPLHNHPVDANLIVTPSATTAAATASTPGATLVPAMMPVIGGGPSATTLKGYGVANGSTTLAPSTVAGSVGFAGGGQPFGILNPYLALNYIICTEGLFPSRN
jgi:microcystin-dependent protein